MPHTNEEIDWSEGYDSLDAGLTAIKLNYQRSGASVTHRIGGGQITIMVRTKVSRGKYGGTSTKVKEIPVQYKTEDGLHYFSVGRSTKRKRKKKTPDPEKYTPPTDAPVAGPEKSAGRVIGDNEFSVDYVDGYIPVPDEVRTKLGISNGDTLTMRVLTNQAIISKKR